MGQINAISSFYGTTDHVLGLWRDGWLDHYFSSKPFRLDQIGKLHAGLWNDPKIVKFLWDVLWCLGGHFSVSRFSYQRLSKERLTWMASGSLLLLIFAILSTPQKVLTLPGPATRRLLFYLILTNFCLVLIGKICFWDFNRWFSLRSPQVKLQFFSGLVIVDCKKGSHIWEFVALIWRVSSILWKLGGTHLCHWLSKFHRGKKVETYEAEIEIVK